MSKVVQFPKKREPTLIPAMYEHTTSRDVVLFISPIIGHCVGHGVKDSKLNTYSLEEVVILETSVLNSPDWRRSATGSTLTFTQD